MPAVLTHELLAEAMRRFPKVKQYGPALCFGIMDPDVELDQTTIPEDVVQWSVKQRAREWVRLYMRFKDGHTEQWPLILEGGKMRRHGKKPLAINGKRVMPDAEE